MLDVFAEDRCCGKRIIKASREGKLEGREEWTCPKCGTVWKPTQTLASDCVVTYGLKLWQPVPVIMVF